MLANVLKSPLLALTAGVAMTCVWLALALIGGSVNLPGATELVARSAHVFSAMVWVGFIVFVNVIQLVAMAEASDADRAIILRTIVPRTSKIIGLVATLTVVTGLVLLVWLGYLTQKPFLSAVWMWIGTLVDL